MRDHTREEFVAWLAENALTPRRIAVLTGAGISAESGIPTFRGTDLLWRDMDPAELFTVEALQAQTQLVWEMYDELRTRIAAASPNAGHTALAALAHHRELTLATQNIDGLHQRAGSDAVLELHGNLWRLRCDHCRYHEENTQTPLQALPPACPGCDGILRPDIVLFSEPLPVDALLQAREAAANCDVILVIGTSGVVYPAAGLPLIARAHGAYVVEINPFETPLSHEADFSIRAPAARALPWLAEILSAE